MHAPSHPIDASQDDRGAHRHRGPIRLTPLGVVLAAMLALVGCGSSTTTANKVEHSTISFKSAAIPHGTIPAAYTCDGEDVAPPLEWGTVPPATKELALFVLGLNPTSTKNRYHVSVEWALAGIDPRLHKLADGRLPPTAHLGRSSKGTRRYSLCPRKGTKTYYQFLVYAVPPKAKVPATYNGQELLRVLVAPHGRVAATAGGSFIASYTRR